MITLAQPHERAQPTPTGWAKDYAKIIIFHENKHYFSKFLHTFLYLTLLTFKNS